MTTNRLTLRLSLAFLALMVCGALAVVLALAVTGSLAANEGQETVLLHLQSKLYYTLNVTGTHIWRGLRKDLTLREISQRLQHEFIVDAEAADQCVLRLVDELCRQKLVETPDNKESVEPTA